MVQVNSRSCVYNLANTLTDEMKKHPKVQCQIEGLRFWIFWFGWIPTV